jgi:uncharacterized protein
VNSYRIIDSHTHCYPPAVTRDPRAWARTQQEPHWAQLVAPLNKASIQGWATPQQMLAAMDEAGVDQAMLLGWYWENEATCRWHNQVIAEWVKIAPKRFIGFAAILPNKNVLPQLEFAQRLGLRGVGELHSGVQQFHADSSAWLRLAEWCVAHGWPVNLHASESAGLPHLGRVATPLQDFVDMAAATPALNIILAHWGGGLPFFEQNPRLRKILKNVYYDTSASPLLYQIEIFNNMVDLVGAEKIIFGSDYPLRVYPRQCKQADMGLFVQKIQKDTELQATDYQAIFHNNINRLISATAATG